MLDWIKTRQQRTEIAKRLYERIVTSARQPVFYTDLGVADTISGRFELERLKSEGEEGQRLGQRLVEIFFRTIDHEFREMGIGDLSVPKKVSKAAEAVYGRLQAYSKALTHPSAVELVSALERNVYDGTGVDEHAGRLADYVRQSHASLVAQSQSAIMGGDARFPDLSGLAASRDFGAAEPSKQTR